MKCTDFLLPALLRNSPLTRHWRHEMLDDQILVSLPPFSLQIDSMIRRVCQCKFRTIFLLIQAPRKTHDREGICELNSQLSENCIHIFLCMQCHCTMTWRWSSHWSAQVHTVGLSLDFESSRGGPTSEFEWKFFSTRIPSACRRFESYPWSDCFPNTMQFCSTRSQWDHLTFFPRRAQSRRRRRFLRWWSDKPFHTISLSASA